MIRLLALAGMVFALALVLASGDVEAARRRDDGKKKAKHHTFKGVIVKVHHAKKDGKHHGTILVKHHVKGKAGDFEEKTFHVNEKTHFEKVEAKKSADGKKHEHATNFSHVHKGQHVVVHYHNHNGHHHASELKIVPHHHAKK